MPFQGFYTSTEVTKMLRVSPITLRRWVMRGLINRHRIGNMAFYKMSEIDAYVKNMTRNHDYRSENE